MGGTPIAFQIDDTYRELFPLVKLGSTTVTGAVFSTVNSPRRQYDPTCVDRCSYCGKGRVFECQLMPHLISLLQKPHGDGGKETSKTLEERKREVERLVKGVQGGASPDDMTGQEWGTCMIFVCSDDCCVEKNEKGERWETQSCWREEVVLVQWES